MSKLSLETAKRQFVLYGFNIKELERTLDSFMGILEGIDSKSQKDPATIVVQSTIEATMMIWIYRRQTERIFLGETNQKGGGCESIT